MIYNCLESKEAFLDAILFVIADEKETVSKSISRNEILPKQRLRTMIEGTFTMVQTNLYHWKLMMSLSLQDEISIRIKEKFAVQRTVGMQQLTHLFEENGSRKFRFRSLPFWKCNHRLFTAIYTFERRLFIG